MTTAGCRYVGNICGQRSKYHGEQTAHLNAEGLTDDKGIMAESFVPNPFVIDLLAAALCDSKHRVSFCCRMVSVGLLVGSPAATWGLGSRVLLPRAVSAT
jgi:hypothetical protein